MTSPLPPSPPPSYVVHRDPKGRRWHVYFEWAEVGGRYEVVGVRVLANPSRAGRYTAALTADALRRIPLGTLITDAKRRHAANVLRMAAKHDDLLQGAEDVARAWGPRRGTALTPTDLEQVARAYNLAAASYMPVTQAVADACNVSKSTAGKRIMAARKAGLIPERN